MASYLPDLPGELRKIQWMVGRWFPPRDVTCQTRNGTMTFNNRAGVVARRLYSRRQWSWPLIQNCQRLLREEGWLAEDCRKNGVFINVGAHIGSVVVPMMQQSNFVAGLAFEPSPQNYHYLKKNIRQNGLEGRVDLFPFGVSDSERQADFALSADNCGDNRVCAAKAPRASDAYRESERKVVTVSLRRLDDVISDWKRPLPDRSLLWVDVQGHEGQVFEGATQTLKCGMPVVTEFWPYGIERSGMGRDRFCATLNKCFEGFFRFGARYRKWKWHPINEAQNVYDEFAGTRRGSDLVLLPR